MKKRSVPLIGLVVIAAAAGGGFYVVGRYTTRHPKEFDWELASIFGTAVGTVLLALATGVLAVMTWSEVGATQEIAQAAREDRAERDRVRIVRVLLARRVREGREMYANSDFSDVAGWRDRVASLLLASVGEGEQQLFLSADMGVDGSQSLSRKTLESLSNRLDELISHSDTSWVVESSFDRKTWN